MRPTSSELFTGMKWSLENEIAPLLEDPRAQSSVRCMVMLLDHLLLRADTEGPVLDQDNREMKQTLQQITEWLKETHLGDTHPAIGSLTTDIETILTDQTNPKEHVPAISVLQEENTTLKGLFLRVIKTVESYKDKMSVKNSNRFKQEIDKLLRQQLNRDFQWIEAPFVGKPHI